MESQPNDQPKRRWWQRHRILVWAICIIVIGGMLISILLPSLCQAREPANRIKCASNLKQIGLAIQDYAQHHEGQYPASLSELLANEEISAEVMTCPSSNDEKASGANTAEVVAELKAAEANAPGHKDCLSYIYAGRGLNTKTVSATAVVLYEPLNNHDGDGSHVLFGDGHVEFIGKQEWPKIVTAANAQVASSATTQPSVSVHAD
jgi:prepilin-type processing-associated H-X9-DG protein